MRRRARAALIGVVAVSAWLVPAGAKAAPGGAMTAVDGNFTGTTGDDVLVIARDADVFTHNRFGAGDPNFASAADFDSTVAGVQTKQVGASTITFSLGSGDDTVEVVGNMPNPVQFGNFGDGSDTLDLKNYASGVSLGASVDASAFPGVERIIGTPFADDLSASGAPAGVGLQLDGRGGNDTLHGGPGNDHLNGGPGDNQMDGAAGDDEFTVVAPFPTTRRALSGGQGNDFLSVDGTSGDDHIGLFNDGALTTVVERANATGGYSLDAVGASVRLLDGNDDALVDPNPSGPITVDGNGGTNEVAVNARQATASLLPSGQDEQQVLIPELGVVRTFRAKLRVLNETLLATAAGPGGGPHVRTFRVDGSPIASFFAYDAGFLGGVTVALGDLDGDLDDEIVTGAGVGGGPHVRVFRSDGTDTGVSFFAYTPAYTGGVNVAAVDVDGDGVDEIVTAPATAGGPHVRIWSADGELLDEWMADGFADTGLRVARGAALGQTGGEQILLSSTASPTTVQAAEADGTPAFEFLPYAQFPGGAFASRGEFAGNDAEVEHGEIVTGAGPGGGPHVRVVDPIGSSQSTDLGGFYAYDPNFRGGVRVTTCNPDGGDDEIVTAAGPGGAPHVRMFTKGGTPLALSFLAYGPDFHGGLRVVCGGAETKTY
ncbi:MAG: hypothetical protein QOI61_1974 [Actinomycetota bacterium]